MAKNKTNPGSGLYRATKPNKLKTQPTTQEVTVTQSANPANLIQLAIEKGADIEKLEKLMALYERFQAGEAKKAFFDGLARFQQVCPEIEKRGRVDYTHNGRRTAFNHALLSDIVREIKPALLAGGLTYRWEQKEDNGVLSVTCIITHTDGHSETTSVS